MTAQDKQLLSPSNVDTRVRRLRPQTGMEQRFLILRDRTWRILLSASVICYASIGCSISGSPAAVSPLSQQTSTPGQVRQADDAGNRLPFVTPFPNRWNSNNDGTQYEPCTAVTTDTLRRSGLVPESVVDVAKSDFQTARGCRWRFEGKQRSALSQSVGNLSDSEKDVLDYKVKNLRTMDWYPNLTIDGRTVIVGSLNDLECTASVQSGNAVVGTTVVRLGGENEPMDTMCQSAVDFLRSTLPQIPR
ncbi:DUF3558 domain-containing protein [Gordonia alkanivorans]|uniref:DUF3558 domain-containing protein n=2 Tax=Gordoniaceae TaxID=85026 RepID=UPI0026D128CB